MDTPIFWSLLNEYRRAGRKMESLPYRTIKPKGTITFLSETSTGIHPVFPPS